MATCFATPAVLVTADDRDRRKLLVKTMEAAGHTVFTALDRAIALTRLYTHPAPLIPAPSSYLTGGRSLHHP